MMFGVERQHKFDFAKNHPHFLTISVCIPKSKTLG